jgi:hypothetical protein
VPGVGRDDVGLLPNQAHRGRVVVRDVEPPEPGFRELDGRGDLVFVHDVAHGRHDAAAGARDVVRGSVEPVSRDVGQHDGSTACGERAGGRCSDPAGRAE